ncbi:acyltransferase [Bacillus cereus group sp. BfR-BA-01380]|uniref:acyltransferase family protein n=1 Tax=Bacillus cereus group sp. BfR-BA-01380 TaxID=2920324 RepID=UPI001F599CC6|nr:acyltransferase [Bacillus cereus group sp. BfR-BA-01380]
MSDRYKNLDSLRGLAALSVFCGHMYLAFNQTIITRLLFERGIFRGFIAGSEAVTLFFVLSGFVLSLPFYSNKKFNYVVYVFRRFCRIYIPYIIAITIAIVCKEAFYSGKIVGLSDWFNVNWRRGIDMDIIKDHLLLIVTFTSNLDNVVWSLVHEMRISLIFPIVMFLLIRSNLKEGILLAVFLTFISIIFSSSDKQFTGTEIYYTIHCAALFVVGALLAKYRTSLINKISNLTMQNKVFLFVVGIILYLYAHPSFVLNILIPNLNPFYRSITDTWVTSIGAAILIILAISSSKISRILSNNFINFIGKISYSLYLYHLIVLLSCMHLLNGIVPMWAICIISFVGTIIVSSCMYYLVEKPAMKLSKIFTNLINKRKGLDTVEYHKTS